MSRSWRHGKYALEKRPWWQRPWNREWWGRRPYSIVGPLRQYNHWLKRRLHKAERRLNDWRNEE